MKTLSAWVVGIFALGLGLGSFMSSSALSDAAPTDLEAAYDGAPEVDCGEGREALLEPMSVDGATSFKLRCITTEQPQTRTTHVVTPAPQVAATPTPTPPPVIATGPTPSPTPEPVAVETYEDDDDSRSWKESAVVIGGSAGAGAGIGAIAKGKKGAAVGAAIGAATGAAYELIKRDKKN